MKKMFRSLFVMLMAAAMLLSLPGGLIHTRAEENPRTQVVFPEITFPTLPYATLEEAGLSAAQLREAFDIPFDPVFVDDQLRLPSVGEVSFAFYDCNYESRDLQCIDGYYYIDITEEEFAQGYHCTYDGPDDSWQVSYSNSVTNKFIYLKYYADRFYHTITIYPDYYGDYIQVDYHGPNGVYSEDTYEDGVLTRHIASVTRNDGTNVNVYYAPSGEITRVDVMLDYSWYYFYPDTGWQEVPAGFEDADAQYLMELAPSMYHCQHVWQDPTCSDPSICSQCHAFRGSALGHTWAVQDGASRCSLCNILASPLLDLPEISLENLHVVPTLNDLNIPYDQIRAVFVDHLDIRYNNGILSFPVGDGASVEIPTEDGYLYPEAVDGVISLEVNEDALEDLCIYLYYGNDTYLSGRYYNSDGKLLDYYLEFYQDGKYLGYFEEDLEYGMAYMRYFSPTEGDAEPTYAYKDTYFNGAFCEREITYYYHDEMDMELEVRYDADGGILYIEAEVDGDDVYYNFRYNGWSNGRNYYSPAPVPAMAEGKTLEELLALCPSGLDFIQNQNTDTGAKPASGLGLILITALGALVAAGGAGIGGYCLGKKKSDN